jgi:hypothetical protein
VVEVILLSIIAIIAKMVIMASFYKG